MVSIKLFLDRRRPKKDCIYPLNYLLCYKRKKTNGSTGISLREEDWDENASKLERNMRLIKPLIFG
ncbi:hypothetical protein [Desertivirga arenae]|uniref:hypothetical protein n=1 Tax=Desertivirga arenae TaxID=2810309 RepID=UPI00351097F7